MPAPMMTISACWRSVMVSDLHPFHLGIVERLQADLGRVALAGDLQLVLAGEHVLGRNPVLFVAHIADADIGLERVAVAARREPAALLAIAEDGLAAEQHNRWIIDAETGQQLR